MEVFANFTWQDPARTRVEESPNRNMKVLFDQKLIAGANRKTVSASDSVLYFSVYGVRGRSKGTYLHPP